MTWYVVFLHCVRGTVFSKFVQIMSPLFTVLDVNRSEADLLYQSQTSRRHRRSAGSTEVMKLSNLPLSPCWPRTRASGEGEFSPADLYLLACPALFFFPHCLLFPDRDGADCVSLTASAASIPQGAPLTMTRLSAPTGSLWQLTQGKQRRRNWRGGHLLGGRINGRTLTQEKQMPGLN